MDEKKLFAALAAALMGSARACFQLNEQYKENKRIIFHEPSVQFSYLYFGIFIKMNASILKCV